MIIYKLYKETLSISAHRQRVDDKKIDFYSYDQQTAKITVEIKSPGDGKALEAVQDVLIALERGGKKAIHNMTVDNYEENLVSFVLPDQILAQSGSFLCGIYLDYGNNKSLDVGYFRINLKQSLIDKDLPAMEQFYVQSFEELKDDIIQRSSDLQAIIDGIDTDVADKLQTLDDLAEDYAQKASELETTYAPRLTEVTAQLAHKVGGGNLATVNDLDEELLNFIHDGTGGPISVESVPKDKTVTPLKTTFIDVSTNLINTEKSSESYSFDDSTGELVDNYLFEISDYIPVEPETTYVVNTDIISKVGEWNENKNYVRRYTLRLNGLVTTTADTYFLRCTYRITNRSLAQLNKGTTLLPYEPYYKPRLSSDIEVHKTLTENVQYKTMAMVDLYNGFYEAHEPSTLPDRESVTTDYIHAIYDNLVSRYPEYITRRVFATQTNGRTIYMYHFKQPPVDLGSATARPTIYIQSGIHGHEWGAALSVAYFFKALCDEWQANNTIRGLRWNTDFYVVPVLNPWGFDNKTRKNNNGVDLNRDFPTYWEQDLESVDKTTGETPLSQPESQAVDVFLRSSEAENILYFIDTHNFGYYPRTNTYALWLASNDDKMLDFLSRFGAQMNGRLREQYPNLGNDDIVLNHLYTFKNGNAMAYAQSLGFHSNLFEIPYEIQIDEGTTVDKNRKVAQKFSIEATGNMFLGYLQNYDYLAN